MLLDRRIDVHGDVRPGFEAVRAAFADNFRRRRELGGACCAYVRGEKVVDLWGGVRDEASGAPWQQDTMVLVYSATKGPAAMTLALAHSRGWLDYDARVGRYRPEFAGNGKADITVRQLLAHQAGLFAFDEPVDRDVVADLDRLAGVMARARPAWTPGTRQGYHGLTLGFYEGELLRRVDPRHRSLGRFFHEEIAIPLGLDFYIGLPASMPDERLAVLGPPHGLARLPSGFPLRLLFAAFSRRSKIHRALAVNPGSEVIRDAQRVYARDLEVPAGGGVGTARAIARTYSDFAQGGPVLGLRPETLQALMAPAVPPARGFFDECLLAHDVRYALGFTKPSRFWSFGSDGAFGALGAGGSCGFADPANGVAYAYVSSRMGTALRGDPRDLALRAALAAALGIRWTENWA
jgi:CubicO group peptidase (beta-lactamase class C family)